MRLCIALLLLWTVSVRADDGFRWPAAESPSFAWPASATEGGEVSPSQDETVPATDGRAIPGSAVERPAISPAAELSLTIISPATWDCRHCPAMRDQDWSGFDVRFEKRDGLNSYPCAEWTDSRGVKRRLFGKHSPSQVRWSMQQTGVAMSDRIACARTQFDESAAASPTPHTQVAIGLEILSPKPGERLADFGCGDGRWAIAIAETYGNSAVGVEIDRQRALLATQKVADSGVQDRVEIVQGDATKIDVDADIASVYLYPETLSELAPKLRKMRRVVSYLHEIPGMQGKKQGKFWVYERQSVQQSQPTVVTQERPYAIYNNQKWHELCCDDPTCGMRQSIAYQLATRQHVEPVQVNQQRCSGCSACGGNQTYSYGYSYDFDDDD